MDTQQYKSTKALAFEHLNLKYNPFGELTPDERARLAVTNVADFVERLSHSGFALQIMGEQGRGKTSHLLALKRHFPDAAYIYYPEAGPRPVVPQSPILFLDETQRFSQAERLALFKRKAALVIATHQDHIAEFNRVGLEHHTIHLKGISAQRLHLILEKRLEAARRTQGAIPYFEDDGVQTLIAQFGDDLRSMEDYLYDIFQHLKDRGAVRLPL